MTRINVGATMAKIPEIALNPCASCAVRQMSVCCAMQAEELDSLSAIAVSRRFEPGDELLSEGDAATCYMNITEGTVTVYKLMPDGRRQITGFLRAGDLLGLAFNDTYTSTAEALTSVRLCRFPRLQFERLLETHPKMEKRLLTQASNELVAAQEQMMLLGRKTAGERIASFLLGLMRRQEKFGRHGDWLTLAMTRADIADYLGLTTETVSRFFTRMRTQGLIELGSGNQVRLRDRERLEEIAEGMIEHALS